MSLLTEEQIAELTLVHDKWWEGNDNFQEYLIEWNEKQTGKQIEINWNDIDSNVFCVTVKIFYHDKEHIPLGYETLDRYFKPITPHPHAEMIMKYVEVAQRRNDPWVEFEYEACGQWKSLNDHPLWGHNTEYRHIGETK